MGNQDVKISALERRLMALELRKGGASYRSIARELHYSGPGAAYRAIDRALKDVIREPAEKVRTLELARIDAALMAIWTDVKNGHLGAIDRFVKLQERRAKLLGLDAPSRTWLSGPDDTPLVDIEEIARDFDRLVAQVMARWEEEGSAGEPDGGPEGGSSLPVDVVGET